MKIEILNIHKHLKSWKGTGFGLFINDKLIAAFTEKSVVEKNIYRLFDNPKREISIRLVKETADVYLIVIDGLTIGKCTKSSPVYNNIVSLKS